MTGGFTWPMDGLGKLVTSKAGRDRAKTYVIIGDAEAGFVLVADGRVRKVNRPKKKNMKHLVVHQVTDPELTARLANGEPVTDELVRRALKRLDSGTDALRDGPIAKEAEV